MPMDEAAIQAALKRAAGEHPGVKGAVAAETAKRQAAQAPTQDQPATPPEAPPPAEESAEGSAKGRDDKGRFVGGEEKPKSDIVAMREAMKAMKAELRRIAEENERLKGSPATTVAQATPADPMADIVKSMPKDTQDWWAQAGSKLVDIAAERRAKELVGPYLPALDRLKERDTEFAQQEKARREFNDWVTDKMLEGEFVDRNKFIEALADVESKGWRLGRENREHFDAVLTLMKQRNPQATTRLVQGDEAKRLAQTEAEEKARAGGVRPGSAYNPPPVDTSKEWGKQFRTATMTGDHDSIQEMLRARLRGTGLPSERGRPQE